MGACWHGQGGGASAPPPGNVEVFLPQMLSKISVVEVFMHHFEKILSASGGLASRPPSGSCPWTLLGDFRPSDPFSVTPGKNPAGAHEYNVSALIYLAVQNFAICC